MKKRISKPNRHIIACLFAMLASRLAYLFWFENTTHTRRVTVQNDVSKLKIWRRLNGYWIYWNKGKIGGGMYCIVIRKYF